jgi:hypothetical protein
MTTGIGLFPILKNYLLDRVANHPAAFLHEDTLFRDSDTPGIRSSIRLTRTNRGWKMLMPVQATRDLSGPLAGKDISQ